MLNLTQAADTREDFEFRSRTGLEPPIFATSSVLGNIGEPLRTIPDDFEDFEEGDDDGDVEEPEDSDSQDGVSKARLPDGFVRSRVRAAAGESIV